MPASGAGSAPQLSGPIGYLNPQYKEAGHHRYGAAGEGKTGQPKQKTVVRHEMPVYDGRGAGMSLDANAFALTHFASSVAGKLSPESLKKGAVRKTYLAEVEAHVLQVTGAAHVAAVHTLTRTADKSSFMQAYSNFAHCDVGDYFLRNAPLPNVTARNAFLFTKPKLGRSLDLAKFDVCLVNVWQPMRNPALRNPLVLLDWATVGPGDRVCHESLKGVGDGELKRLGGEAQPLNRIAEITQPLHNPRHRWYHFPGTRTDEAIIFKQIDSRPGRALCCFHTSVPDPAAPAAAPERESVETRVVCLFARPPPAAL